MVCYIPRSISSAMTVRNKAPNGDVVSGGGGVGDGDVGGDGVDNCSWLAVVLVVAVVC